MNQDRQQISRFLGRMGFPQLDEPGALIQAIAFMIEDHDELRKALDKCEPEQRRAMYDSLKPHLSFAPKPLDVYIAESKSEAERRQLPIIGPDGMFKPFRSPELASDEYLIQQAIVRSQAKEHLTLTCRKCTKQGEFHGALKADAIDSAREAGWAYSIVSGSASEICPECLEKLPKN